MKRFNLENIRLVLISALVIFLFAFSSKRNNERTLKKSEVEFSRGSNLFITNDVVNKLLIENSTRPESIQRDKVDLNRLEKSVNSHEMIENSEVFLTIDGTLKAVVKQRTPIARVFDGAESYYLDFKGRKMPLSDLYTARVPVVTGELDGKNLEQVTDVLRLIYTDRFLSKNIIGVEVFAGGYLQMKSRSYDYLLDFGSSRNAVEKFRNYKAFLQKAPADSLMSAYKSVNLKFNRQVVCTK